MRVIIGIFIFCIVLFIYIHVYYQLKTSNDREIYILDKPNKKRLEEVANIRQPFSFKYDANTPPIEFPGEHLNIRTTDHPKEDEEMYLPLPFPEAKKLLSKESKYITEHNADLPLYNHVKEVDEYLCPSLLMKVNIDFWSGSPNTHTPLRHFIHFRNYLYVLDGVIKIKLIKPTADLEIISDYDYLEFRTHTNPWTEEIPDAMEIVAKKGDVVFIPAYWWNSVQYGKLSSVVVFQYQTYTNAIAVSPHLVRHFLQQQNIKHRTLKKMELVIPEEKPEEKEEANKSV